MATDDDRAHLGSDRILDLVLGLLPTGDDQRARDHIATCTVCEDRVRAQAARVEESRAEFEIREVERQVFGQRDVLGEARQVTGGARHVAGEARQVAGRAHQVTGETPARDRPPARTARPSLWRGLAGTLRQPLPALGAGLATAALVLWIGTSIFQDRDPWKTQLAELPPISTEIVTRSGAPWPDALRRGIEAYTSGRLDEAIAVLETRSITEDWSTIQAMYLGSALARTARYEQAVTVLSTIESIPFPDPWHGETLWTLYVALRATHEDARADRLLRTLADQPGAARERARSELDTRP